jgi:retron-type reverse transcriptase
VIVEECEDSKKECKKNDKETPQGGVISPLPANIYPNVLNTLWTVKKIQERLGARRVRYSNDTVILCRQHWPDSHSGRPKLVEYTYSSIEACFYHRRFPVACIRA